MVVTDHSALTALTSKRGFENSRLSRYALDLSEFDLLIRHKPGRYHFLPDWMSRAELLDIDAVSILHSEIKRLDSLHEYNTAGLLRDGLVALKSGANGLVDDVLHSEDRIVTVEAGYQDSVVFAPGKALRDLKSLVQQNDATDMKQRRELLFACSTSDSHALQCEDDSINDAIHDATYRLSQVTQAPDDPLPSRAAQIYEAIYNVGTELAAKLSGGATAGLPLDKSAEGEGQRLSLLPMVRQAQSLDLFAVAMRNCLLSDMKALPKDELLRIYVLRLASQYVLDEGDWLCYADPEIQPRLCKPTLYAPLGVRGEVSNRLHTEAGHPAVTKTHASAKPMLY